MSDAVGVCKGFLRRGPGPVGWTGIHDEELLGLLGRVGQLGDSGRGLPHVWGHGDTAQAQRRGAVGEKVVSGCAMLACDDFGGLEALRRVGMAEWDEWQDMIVTGKAWSHEAVMCGSR